MGRPVRSKEQKSNTVAWVLGVWSASALAYTVLAPITQFAILALSFGSLVMLIVAVAGAARSRR